MSEIWLGPVRDEPFDVPVRVSRNRFRGPVWAIRTDTMEFADQVVDRDVIIHPGAVGVIALDEVERVYLMRQYRHPVGMMLFEPPAGLIDKFGELPLETAERELAEEAGLRARTWHTLLDYFTTPGGSSEAIRLLLARDIEPVPGGRVVTGEAEENHLPGVWVPLEEAVELVLAGRLSNPTAVAGILATAAARARGWQGLRAADAPWTGRDWLAQTGRLFDFPQRPRVNSLASGCGCSTFGNLFHRLRIGQ